MGGNSLYQQHVLNSLYSRYRTVLMSYFFRRVRSRAEAEDLTQETFLRICRTPETEFESADAFIFAIAANLLKDRDRRAVTRRAGFHLSFDGASFGGEENFVQPASLVEEISPERVLIGREALASLMEALNGLSESTRYVFLLFRLENMKQSEIASLCGISVSAVEKKVAKALAHIAKTYRQD